MRLLRLIVAAAFAATLAACSTATTTNAVGTSGGPQADTRLLGTWVATSPKEDGKYYVFFTARSGEGYDMEAVGVAPPHGDDKGSWTVIAVTTGKVGELGFLNGRVLFDNGKPGDRSDYFPVLYRIEGRELTFLPLDIKAAKAAVEAHDIAGRVEDDDDVVITAEPAALDAYAASHAATLFKALPEMPAFHRVD